MLEVGVLSPLSAFAGRALFAACVSLVDGEAPDAVVFSGTASVRFLPLPDVRLGFSVFGDWVEPDSLAVSARAGFSAVASELDCLLSPLGIGADSAAGSVAVGFAALAASSFAFGWSACCLVWDAFLVLAEGVLGAAFDSDCSSLAAGSLTAAGAGLFFPASS